MENITKISKIKLQVKEKFEEMTAIQLDKHLKKEAYYDDKLNPFMFIDILKPVYFEAKVEEALNNDKDALKKMRILAKIFDEAANEGDIVASVVAVRTGEKQVDKIINKKQMFEELANIEDALFEVIMNALNELGEDELFEVIKDTMNAIDMEGDIEDNG